MVVWNQFFESINCGLYHYAANNPVRYTDPDGREHGIPYEVQKILDKQNLENLKKLGKEMFFHDTFNGIKVYQANNDDGCFARATVIANELDRLGYDVVDYSYVTSPVKPDAVKTAKANGEDPSAISKYDTRRYAFHVAATVCIGGTNYTVDPFYHKSWYSISEQEDWYSCQYPLGTSTEPVKDEYGNFLGTGTMMYYMNTYNKRYVLSIGGYAQGWLRNYNNVKERNGPVDDRYKWDGIK